MKSLTFVSYYSLITSAGERFLQQAKIRQNEIQNRIPQRTGNVHLRERFPLGLV